jgi:hypothetical protein
MLETNGKSVFSRRKNIFTIIGLYKFDLFPEMKIQQRFDGVRGRQNGYCTKKKSWVNDGEICVMGHL